MWYTKIESVKVVGVVDMKKKKEQEETLKNKDKKTEEELFKSLKENRVLLGEISMANLCTSIINYSINNRSSNQYKICSTYYLKRRKKYYIKL